ncbi:hypothetical protein [Enterococcus caccae]|uniref:Uncharacterized protein n=1 Tax=Enterococcus caccae ATCC BAA-1240 TaxID=1158612 RepID=R3X924_9ENTE|nr:hypothetical protein [Enterococcus caccae]EOL50570.1 hypothetical protein UC7_00343 [Enterococcus caccae ATCC BAA-1240]EOT59214.1 hypothetical protein I580_02246 [Enterococcus caccae ATCC BAA-1240]
MNRSLVQDNKMGVEKELFCIPLNKETQKMERLADAISNDFNSFLENKEKFLNENNFNIQISTEGYIYEEYKFFNDDRLANISKTKSVRAFIDLLTEYKKMPASFERLTKYEEAEPRMIAAVNVAIAGNVAAIVEYAVIAAVAYVLGVPVPDDPILENANITFNVQSIRYDLKYLNIVMLAQSLYGETFAKEVDQYICCKIKELPERLLKNGAKKFRNGSTLSSIVEG